VVLCDERKWQKNDEKDENIPFWIKKGAKIFKRRLRETIV